MLYHLLLDIPTITFGDGNGLIFAPKCDGECLTSRKEKKCDHPVNKVSLDYVGEYVVFLSRWYHHGYYNIKSDKVFTAICHGFIQTRGMAEHYTQG